MFVVNPLNPAGTEVAIYRVMAKPLLLALFANVIIPVVGCTSEKAADTVWGAEGTEGIVTVAWTVADGAEVPCEFVAVIVKFVRPPCNPVMVAGDDATLEVTVCSVIVLYALIV